MRKIIAFLALAFSFNAIAAGVIGNLGQRNMVTIGNQNWLYDGTVAKQLGCFNTSGSVGCTLRDTTTTPPGSAGYTPASGQKFCARAVSCDASSSSATSVGIGYADNDIGMNSSTALTNPNYYGGNSGMELMQTPAVRGGVPTERALVAPFVLPNGKYLQMITGGSVSCHVVGEEKPTCP